MRGTSHYALLEAFFAGTGALGTADDALASALEHAERAGYLQREFGDALLVRPEREGERRAS
jgi:hypothetical protein